MLFVARFAFVLTLLLATAFGAGATERVFAHQGVSADAKRYETYLKANWKPDGKPPAALKTEAEKIFATDPRAASRSLANVVAANDKDSAAWTRLAEALLAIKPDPGKGSERYDLPIYASGAAYHGYQRATEPAQKAHALYVLGRTLEARSYWRPAIDAMKLSLDIADNTPVSLMYYYSTCRERRGLASKDPIPQRYRFCTRPNRRRRFFLGKPALRPDYQ